MIPMLCIRLKKILQTQVFILLSSTFFMILSLIMNTAIEAADVPKFVEQGLIETVTDDYDNNPDLIKTIAREYVKSLKLLSRKLTINKKIIKRRPVYNNVIYIHSDPETYNPLRSRSGILNGSRDQQRVHSNGDLALKAALNIDPLGLDVDPYGLHVYPLSLVEAIRPGKKTEFSKSVEILNGRIIVIHSTVSQ